LEVTFYDAFFGEVWANSGINPSHPENLPAPATMPLIVAFISLAV